MRRLFTMVHKLLWLNVALLIACASTASPTTSPMSPQLATVGDCVLLDADSTTEVYRTLKRVGDSECLVLANQRINATTANPSTWIRRNGSWNLQVLTGFEGQGWNAMAQDQDVIFALLDSEVESPGWEIGLLSSRDGGQSWQRIGTLRKSYYLAVIEGFEMKGELGAISLFLEDDYGSPNKAGWYHYRTTDRGQSWLGPEFVALSEK